MKSLSFIPFVLLKKSFFDHSVLLTTCEDNSEKCWCACCTVALEDGVWHNESAALASMATGVHMSVRTIRFTCCKHIKKYTWSMGNNEQGMCFGSLFIWMVVLHELLDMLFFNVWASWYFPNGAGPLRSCNKQNCHHGRVNVIQCDSLFVMNLVLKRLVVALVWYVCPNWQLEFGFLIWKYHLS
jgi:hypothetical protein